MATPKEMLTTWDKVQFGAVLPSFEDPKSKKRSKFHSYNYKVADWRVEKPVFNRELCIDCNFCWIWCPDSCIIVEEVTTKRGKKQAKMVGIDYDHCKGCGVCVEVCPTPIKSLLMFPEYTPIDEALAQWPKKDEQKKD
jgi:pyruvate ferredoxin oxidoreductase delta subunit